MTKSNFQGGHSTNIPPADVQLASAQRELTRLKHGAINVDFIQVSKVYIDEINSLSRYAQSAAVVLWELVKQMNKQNAVMISQDSLATLTKLSKPTIKRALALLREQQWIDILKVGTANVYRVNSAVFWQDRADGRWASFSAQVVVNFEEQDEAIRAMPAVRTRHIPFVEADDVIALAAMNTKRDQDERIFSIPKVQPKESVGQEHEQGRLDLDSSTTD